MLSPVIHHFGMMGAAITAVAAQMLERLIIAWKAARAVDASVRDLPLYGDLFKVTAVTIVAGIVAHLVRNLIRPSLLAPRILAVAACVAAIYIPAMYFFHLPGWEMLSKDRLLTLLRSKLGRLRAPAHDPGCPTHSWFWNEWEVRCHCHVSMLERPPTSHTFKNREYVLHPAPGRSSYLLSYNRPQ